jgi:hypothetical protein
LEVPNMMQNSSPSIVCALTVQQLTTGSRAAAAVTAAAVLWPCCNR